MLGSETKVNDVLKGITRDTAIQLCKDKSCYKISLNCNESSKNFYRKNGFIENEYQMVYFICNDLKK